MTTAALVFAKPPRPGVSKTRLAAVAGETLAARLAGAFLVDTVAGLRRHGLHVVLATTDVDADFGPVDVPRVAQGTGGLGERLQRVLARALTTYDRVVAFGADSPGVPPATLAALDILARDHDAAFIPAADGGFVALSLGRLPDGAFDGIRWSAPTTLDELDARLVGRGMQVARTTPWFDIDHHDDLQLFRERVPRAHAPATWAVLDGLP